MDKDWKHVPGFQIGTNKTTPKTKDLSIIRGVRYHNRTYRQLEAWLTRQNDPSLQLLIEPWLMASDGQMCQPDAVILDGSALCAMVIEVKLNWKDGRDEKLRDLYLPAVSKAFSVDVVWPALITSNVQYLNRSCYTGLNGLIEAMAWREPDPTPVILFP